MLLPHFSILLLHQFTCLLFRCVYDRKCKYEQYIYKYPASSVCIRNMLTPKQETVFACVLLLFHISSCWLFAVNKYHYYLHLIKIGQVLKFYLEENVTNKYWSVNMHIPYELTVLLALLQEWLIIALLLYYQEMWK